MPPSASAEPTDGGGDARKVFEISGRLPSLLRHHGAKDRVRARDAQLGEKQQRLVAATRILRKDSGERSLARSLGPRGDQFGDARAHVAGQSLLIDQLEHGLGHLRIVRLRDDGQVIELSIPRRLAKSLAGIVDGAGGCRRSGSECRSQNEEEVSHGERHPLGGSVRFKKARFPDRKAPGHSQMFQWQRDAFAGATQ
jgi:hypothetical protein